MLNLDDVYKKVEDNWVSRMIFDEVVIVPLCRSEEDMQFIYSISNETGSRLWQLLDGGHSVKDIQEILKSEYQGQGEVIEREVLEFVGDLLEVKLIERTEHKRSASIEPRASSIQHPEKKKSYTTPEIAKVKMQPEQAVLACCARNSVVKSFGNLNYCVSTLCGSAQQGCAGNVTMVTQAAAAAKS